MRDLRFFTIDICSICAADQNISSRAVRDSFEKID